MRPALASFRFLRQVQRVELVGSACGFIALGFNPTWKDIDVERVLERAASVKIKWKIKCS